MKNLLIKSLFLILFLASFINAQEPVNVDDLIKEVLSYNQEFAMSGYSYQMEFTRHKKANFFGTRKLIKRYQAILPSKIPQDHFYKHPLLLVYDSSKNITPKAIVENRNRIVKELEKIENPSEIENTDWQKKDTGGYITLGANKFAIGKQPLKIDITRLLKNSAFSNPKQVEKYGKNLISLDFVSSPEQSLEKSLFYLSSIEGRILIDSFDKRIVEIEGYPKAKKELYKDLAGEEREKFRVFHFQQIKVREGFWFPKQVTLNFMEFPEEFNGLEVKIDFIFTNYQHFTVEIESSEVTSPDNKSEEKENQN